MDQGIIQNLKVHYRKLVIMKQLKSIERNTELQITVLDSLRMLYQTWDRVTEKTIKNCFCHANFVRAATNEHADSPDNDEEDPEDDIPLAALRLLVLFDDYAQIDNTVITTEAVTDKDIMNNIIAARNKGTEEDEEVKKNMEPPKKKPTLQKVDAALEVIQD